MFVPCLETLNPNSLKLVCARKLAMVHGFFVDGAGKFSMVQGFRPDGARIFLWCTDFCPMVQGFFYGARISARWCKDFFMVPGFLPDGARISGDGARISGDGARVPVHQCTDT